METISLNTGLQLQATQVKHWLTILNRDAAEALKTEVNHRNASLPQPATGNEVWKGKDISGWLYELAAQESQELKEEFMYVLKHRIEKQKHILNGMWEADVDAMTGAFYFENGFNGVNIYATPFYETDEDVICVEDGLHDTIHLPFILTGNLEMDLRTYFKLVTDCIVKLDSENN